MFFFFKQKTAYEMRISDWSSDVCSSDLRLAGQGGEPLLESRQLAQDREAVPPQRRAARDKGIETVGTGEQRVRGEQPAERMAEQYLRAVGRLGIARRDFGAQRARQEGEKRIRPAAFGAADRRGEPAEAFQRFGPDRRGEVRGAQSAERRGGKEWGGRGKSRGSPYH